MLAKYMTAGVAATALLATVAFAQNPSPTDANKPPAAAGYRMPAEWQRHEATWIGWPHNPTDWPGKFAAIPWVYVEIVRRRHARRRRWAGRGRRASGGHTFRSGQVRG